MNTNYRTILEELGLAKCAETVISNPVDITIERCLAEHFIDKDFEHKECIKELTALYRELDESKFNKAGELFIKAIDVRLKEIIEEFVNNIRPSESKDLRVCNGYSTLAMEIHIKGVDLELIKATNSRIIFWNSISKRKRYESLVFECIKEEFDEFSNRQISDFVKWHTKHIIISLVLLQVETLKELKNITYCFLNNEFNPTVRLKTKLSISQLALLISSLKLDLVNKESDIRIAKWIANSFEFDGSEKPSEEWIRQLLSKINNKNLQNSFKPNNINDLQDLLITARNYLSIRSKLNKHK